MTDISLNFTALHGSRHRLSKWNAGTFQQQFEKYISQDPIVDIVFQWSLWFTTSCLRTKRFLSIHKESFKKQIYRQFYGYFENKGNSDLNENILENWKIEFLKRKEGRRKFHPILPEYFLSWFPGFHVLANGPFFSCFSLIMIT